MSSIHSSGITLTANDLAKRFNREWIFRRLTYTFLPNSTYAIKGPNGSGKSTLLQILWGQSPPTSGTLHFQNGETQLELENIYKSISIATPYMDLIDEFTLMEQLDLHFKVKSIRGELTKDALLEKMYLTNARNKQIGNFSSGMRQRLKLALAFFTQADLIFLDEPGTNLDRQAFEWYLRLLETFHSKCLIFIASNNPDEYPVVTGTIDIMNYK
jgi:ABC-type multidrug transport system ATPase subunit